MPQVRVGTQIVEAHRLTLRCEEVAAAWGVDRREVVNAVRRGELEDISVDRTRRLDPAQVAAVTQSRIDTGTLKPMAIVILAELIGSSGGRLSGS